MKRFKACEHRGTYMIIKVLANFILGYGVPAKAERKGALGAVPGNGGTWTEQLYKSKHKDHKTKQVNAIQAPEDLLCTATAAAKSKSTRKHSRGQKKGKSSYKLAKII